MFTVSISTNIDPRVSTVISIGGMGFVSAMIHSSCPRPNRELIVLKESPPVIVRLAAMSTSHTVAATKSSTSTMLNTGNEA